ncbi:hypothetical protein ACJJTC_003270 [Scirpophaga incertulas]
MEKYGVVGLKPPQPLTTLTAEGYKKWLQLFQLYLRASGGINQDEETQIAVLLHCMGEQCVEIYNTFNFNDEEEKKFDSVIDQFNKYFIPIQNECFNSHIFFSRNQLDGEKIDSYVTELKKLASDCNFGELKNRLIRDRIVAGIIDSRLRDRLLRETDLTMEKCIMICKSAEIISEQTQRFQTSESVHPVYKKKSLSQKIELGRCTTNNNQNEYRRKSFVCSRCGGQHPKMKCPAFNKRCSKCNRSVTSTLPKFENKKFKNNNSNYRQELQRKQFLQEKYYNKHTRKLPEIDSGKVVKIKDENSSGPHKSGIVLGQAQAPRSYIVKTEEGGLIVRNRRDLIPNGKYYDRSRIYEESEESSVIHNNNNIEKNVNVPNNLNCQRLNNSNVQNKSDTLESNSKYTTRSGREIKRPKHLADYC